MKSDYPHELAMLPVSLPAWECGLKSSAVVPKPKGTLSLPAWECGLKCCESELKKVSISGHSLAWECGLKSSMYSCNWRKRFASLPAWECGLKSDFAIDVAEQVDVTPCVGVWIEIERP